MRIIYQEITGNNKMEMKPPPVTNKDQMEIWWDEHIWTVTKIEKNRPDIIIWHSDKVTVPNGRDHSPLRYAPQESVQGQTGKIHTTHYQHAMCTQKI